MSSPSTGAGRGQPVAPTHRHDWLRAGARLTVVNVIDDHFGITDAVLRCDCGEGALLNLLDWRESADVRVYAVSPLPGAALRVFARNMKSDYCDLTRKADECHALAASADPVSAIVLAALPHLELTAVHRAPPGLRRPAWRDDGLPDTDWFAVLRAGH